MSLNIIPDSHTKKLYSGISLLWLVTSLNLKFFFVPFTIFIPNHCNSNYAFLQCSNKILQITVISVINPTSNFAVTSLRF